MIPGTIGSGDKQIDGCAAASLEWYSQYVASSLALTCDKIRFYVA
jgi:hypothetical protein